MSRRLTVRIVTLAFGIATGTVASAQCMTWTRRTDVGHAGPQVGHCLAYNPDRQRVALFTADDWAELWEYDGRQWLRVFITPGPRPGPRVDSALAYDRARGELVLVGGFGRQENTELADTWTCRLTTDATGNVVGTWTRRSDFPDFAVPDEDDPSGQMGESGARSEHTLVYDEAARAVRLFGGKARIVRGSRYQRPYNLENYSAGRGAWNGTAWVQRSWGNIVSGPTNDPDEPVLLGTLYQRVELGRKAIAGTYDPRRQRVITYGGLRQIYQRYNDGSLWDPDENDAYVESMPHLQYFPTHPGSLTQNFPSFSRNLLDAVGGHCGNPLVRRVFGAQIVHDTWRDRYVAFGGAYVFEPGRDGVECSPQYNIETSTYDSKLLPQINCFREWNPQRPSPPDDYFDVSLPSERSGGDFLAHAPASRVRHAMVFDEHRGVTVMVGGWDGFNLSTTGLPTETWEYGPNNASTGFAQQPPPLTELCLGDTLTLTATPRHAWPAVDGTTGYRQNQFQWYRDATPLNETTRDTLTIAAVDPSHAGAYTCRLIDPCGNVSETSPAIVRVGGPPVITRHPATVRVCPGDDAEARFFFTSDYPATIQWFRIALDASGSVSLAAQSPLPGEDSNTLQFLPMHPADNGYYRARVSNRCGTAWTVPIEMTAGVWLKQQPAETTNTVCAPVALPVLASGKGTLRFQWRRNGTAMTDTDRITGTAQSRLKFARLRYLDDAVYDCIVSDLCHSLTTRLARLVITPNPPFLLADTLGPAPRTRHRLVYDEHRRRSVLFGGLGTNLNTTQPYLADTWEYDGTSWQQRFVAQSPSPRSDFGLTYDPQRRRVVLFGGATNSLASGSQPNGETWEYDGTNWLQRLPPSAPAPRVNPALFYDPIHHVTTLYGGDTSLDNPRQGDIWTWDGERWNQKSISGPRPLFGGIFGSPPRPQMVWDESRGYAVMPPTVANEPDFQKRVTWTWDGERWTPRDHVFTAFGLTPSTSGSGGGLVYDTYRQEVIYWGGDGNDQQSLWRWNGSDWRRDEISERVGFCLDAANAYDRHRHSVVQFSGRYSGGDPFLRGTVNWTLERILADEPQLLRQPSLRTDPVTRQPSLRVVAAGAPPLTYEWQRDGRPLAERSGYSGTDADTLVVDPALDADTGHYRCVVRGPCGEVPSFAITLTGEPAADAPVLTATSAPLAGRPGLLLSWTEPSVALEHAPSPTGPWSTIPGAVSPWRAPLTEASGYFRLRGP